MSNAAAQQTQKIRDPREVKIKRALLSVSDKKGLVESKKQV